MVVAERAAEPVAREREQQRRWVVALGLLAAAPVLLAAWESVRTTRVNVLLDYWHVLAKVTSDSGSLEFGPLWSYHLEQPFVLPSLLFYGDAAWFGGDNRVLTLLTVGLLVVALVGMRSMLAVGGVARAVVVAVFAFLLCTPHLAELWVQATNGISWVPAVVLSVLAVVAAHHGRVGFALAAAAVGVVSFGAAMPVWFAVALVLWLRRERWWRVVVPAVVGVVVVVGWLATRPPEAQSMASSGFAPVARAKVVAAVLGSVWTSATPAVAVVVGAVVGAVLVGLGIAAARRRGSAETVADAGWVGLAAYAVAVAVLIGLGRTTPAAPGGNAGLISRYALAGVLATCALVALLVRRRPVSGRVAVPLAVALVAITFVTGTAKAGAVRNSYAPLGVVPVALRMENTRALAALQVQPAVLPAAKALGMYPFDGTHALGCADLELGDRVDPARIRDLPRADGVVDAPALTEDTVVAGWADLAGRAGTCALVTTPDGLVVGGGITALPRPDVPRTGGLAGFRVVVSPGASDVLVHLDGTFHRVLGRPDA